MRNFINGPIVQNNNRIALSYPMVDNDPTLAANSDALVPTQKAVKTFVGQSISDANVSVNAAISELQAIVASDNPDLDTVQEIVNYILALNQVDQDVAAHLQAIDAILASNDSTLDTFQELVNAIGLLAAAVSDHGDRLTALESVVAVDDPDFDTLQEVVDYLKALNVATYTASTTPPTNTQIPWYDTSDGTWSVFNTVSGTWVSTVLPPLPAP